MARAVFYIYTTIDPWISEELGVFKTKDFLKFIQHHLNWPTKKACISPTSGGAMVWAPLIEKAADGKLYIRIHR